MKAKLLKLTAFFLLTALLFLCSCNAKEVSTYAQISAVKDKFSSSLTNVRIYSSDFTEEDDGHIDPAFIAALLGDGEEIPDEIKACKEYSFLCSSELSICEAWAVECRTYSSARDVEAIFERRREVLSKQDFESESDISAVTQAKVQRCGRRVYFVAAENSAEILRYLTDF